MPSAYGLQDGVLHGLGIDAHPVYPVAADDLQLFLRDGVGPPRLNGIIPQGGQVKGLRQFGAELVQLPRREGGGGSASNIDGNYPQPKLSDDLCRGLNVLVKGFEKGGNKLHAFLHRKADKAAVGAAGGAEGYAYIKADIFRREALLYTNPRPGRFQAQEGLFPGYVVFPGKPGQGRRLGHALLQIGSNYFAGAYSRQGAPDGFWNTGLHSRPVEGQLYYTLEQAVFRQIIGKGGPRNPGRA